MKQVTSEFEQTVSILNLQTIRIKINGLAASISSYSKINFLDCCYYDLVYQNTNCWHKATATHKSILILIRNQLPPMPHGNYATVMSL